MFPIDPNAAAPAADQLVKSSTRSAAQLMQSSAQDQAQQAKRLAAAAERLAAKLGKDHPRVAALRRAGDTSRILAEVISSTAKRLARTPGLRPGVYTITGRLADATGAAVAGIRVRLTAGADGKRIPGDAVTDEFGDFAIEIPEGAVDPQGDLIVVAEDSRGRPLDIPETLVRVMPGALARVDLVLGRKEEASPGVTPPKPPRVKRTPSRKPEG